MDGDKFLGLCGVEFFAGKAGFSRQKPWATPQVNEYSNLVSAAP
jgi:hypothetical protein